MLMCAVENRDVYKHYRSDSPGAPKVGRGGPKVGKQVFSWGGLGGRRHRGPGAGEMRLPRVSIIRFSPSHSLDLSSGFSYDSANQILIRICKGPFVALVLELIDHRRHQCPRAAHSTAMKQKQNNA